MYVGFVGLVTNARGLIQFNLGENLWPKKTSRKQVLLTVMWQCKIKCNLAGCIRA